MHRQTRLAGQPSRALLDLPDPVLSYLIAVLGPGVAAPAAPELAEAGWQDLIDRLSPQGILPYFYWRLSSLPEDRRPPVQIRDRLKNIFLASAARSLRQAAQLGKIEQALAAAGIRCLVLKGLALSRTVYPEPGLRPSADIDILVRPEQMAEADGILLSLGYARKSDNFRLYRELTIEEIYTSADKNRCLVELHWDNHHFRGLPTPEGPDGLFARAVPGPVPGSGCLSPEDSLINAAIHLAMQHAREVRLIWIMDIALLAKELKDPADWQALKDRSRLWQVRPAAAHCLELARLWFGLEPPADFSAFLSDPPLSRAERRAWPAALRRYRDLFSLLRIRGPRSPAALWCFIFPPARIMKEKYDYRHYWQLPACYLKRWLRLFQKD